MAFIQLRPEGLSQTKVWTCELNPQISVRCGNIDLLTLQEEMEGGESTDRRVEDHDLCFTQVDCQLLKVEKTREGIQLLLKTLWGGVHKFYIINKEERY